MDVLIAAAMKLPEAGNLRRRFLAVADRFKTTDALPPARCPWFYVLQQFGEHIDPELALEIERRDDSYNNILFVWFRFAPHMAEKIILAADTWLDHGVPVFIEFPPLPADYDQPPSPMIFNQLDLCGLYYRIQNELRPCEGLIARIRELYQGQGDMVALQDHEDVLRFIIPRLHDGTPIIPMNPATMARLDRCEAPAGAGTQPRWAS